ncbi:MAG: hypothetical protein V4620_08450 [Bacteroidota bacterium]
MLSLFFYCEKINAQYSVRASYIKPSGIFGYTFKPTVEAEIAFVDGEIDSKFRFGFSIGYYSLTARQDTFFSYGIRNGSVYLPAYSIWNSYKALPLALNLDYKILDKRFSPILGLDGVITLVDYKYISDLNSSYHKDVTGGTVTGGFITRVGLQYELSDNFLIATSFGKNFGLDFKTMDANNIWKMQLGIVYYPN